ncbi:hypothetical protein EVAR_4722_1 [Eumeta japonica]|uniref:Uncharacterized protein n=1 Tax=Eumeta variegata TaxID=151549 RepID=A0A4C1SZD5_EUMVA|nr:hypothetical protein EVAR_4722_1 [Eumeta japonica]
MPDYILRKLHGIRSKNLMVLTSCHIHRFRTLRRQITISSKPWPHFFVEKELSPKGDVKMQCGNSLYLSLRKDFTKVVGSLLNIGLKPYNKIGSIPMRTCRRRCTLSGRTNYPQIKSCGIHAVADRGAPAYGPKHIHAPPISIITNHCYVQLVWRPQRPNATRQDSRLVRFDYQNF